MRYSLWATILSVLLVTSAWAGLKPVAFRLASLPATAEPGQRLLLCATNIGTGELYVTLEFVNVRTGGIVAEQTVRLAPLGGGATAPPCITTDAQAIAAASSEITETKPPLSASFASASTAAEPLSSQSLVVGVAMVRKSLLSFREAQVTASMQVLAPDAGGVMRTVGTIPLSRTAHPSDGAPVYAPASIDNAHHK